MKVILVFVLAFGLVSCMSTELNELRVSDSSESKTFTLVAKRETSIKQNPSSDSGAKAGIVCRIPVGTKVLVQGYTKYAEGSHVQANLSAIIPAGADISDESQNQGEPSIVPVPSSDSMPFSGNSPLGSSEPIIRDEDGIVRTIKGNPFELSPSTPVPESTQEIPSSVECGLLGQTAYLFSEHFEGLEASQPPIDALFEGYDPIWGQKIALTAGNQYSVRKYFRGQCYTFVADVLQRALGRTPNWPPLNKGGCARSFSDGWNPKVNEREFRLRKIATRDPKIVDKLPVGSVLVTAWCGKRSPPNVCAGPGYGDIMIKGKADGTMYSATEYRAVDDKPGEFWACGIKTGNLIAVFIPIK